MLAGRSEEGEGDCGGDYEPPRCSGFIPGLVILAPGYVGIYASSPYVARGAVRSVEAGPAANIVIGLAALLASYILAGQSAFFLRIVAMVNGWIALFNLIPVPPLDGSKIMRADFNSWITMLLLALVLWWVP